MQIPLIAGLFGSKTQHADNMAKYMALQQKLKSLVHKRLSEAAVEEIIGMVGRIITEYEDLGTQLKQEIEVYRLQNIKEVCKITTETLVRIWL